MGTNLVSLVATILEYQGMDENLCRSTETEASVGVAKALHP